MGDATTQLRLAPLDALVARQLLIAVRKTENQVQTVYNKAMMGAEGPRKGE